MSVWSNLLSWALKSAKTEAQSEGLKALQGASTQLTTVLSQHAPDLAPTLQPLIQQVVSTAIAGILTRTGQ